MRTAYEVRLEKIALKVIVDISDISGAAELPVSREALTKQTNLKLDDMTVYLLGSGRAFLKEA